jgi:hypothetical protein
MQGKKDSRLGPDVRVPVDSDVAGDFIGGLKPDAKNVSCEAIGFPWTTLMGSLPYCL